MRDLKPCLAFVLLIQTAAAQTPDEAVRNYMLCARRNAEFLEPSGDPPQDVARAAVALCQQEEVAAFKARGGANTSAASNLRETAIFYGAMQSTAARACRVAQRCGLATLPNSN